MKSFALLAIFLCSILTASAQEIEYYSLKDSVYSPSESKLSLGFGLDLPYGGAIGVKVNAVPIEGLRLGLGLGYFVSDLGVNLSVGTDFRLKSRLRPHVSLMYGTNAFIYVDGAPSDNKVYFGFSPAFGCLLVSKRRRKNFWEFGFAIPIRNARFRDDYDRLEKDPTIDIDPPDLIYLYVGYNIQF